MAWTMSQYVLQPVIYIDLVPLVTTQGHAVPFVSPANKSATLPGRRKPQMLHQDAQPQEYAQGVRQGVGQGVGHGSRVE